MGWRCSRSSSTVPSVWRFRSVVASDNRRAKTVEAGVETKALSSSR